ncbi:MAG: hypothetical protein ACKO38_05370 [Planctomycetota bacterium]
MNAPQDSSERQRQLIAELIDGTLSDSDSADLNRLLQTHPQFADQVANQLILDSLLSEELGAEPLAALVDLVGQPCASQPSASQPSASQVPPPAAPPRSFRTSRLGRAFNQLIAARRTWHVAGALATLAVVAVAFVMGRWERMTLASSSDVIVRAAMDAHAAPVERVYVVQTERSPTGPTGSGSPTGSVGSVGFKPPRDVRVATQGDRFYVEMNRGERSWYWGLDRDGSIWITLGSRRAIVIDRANVKCRNAIE